MVPTAWWIARRRASWQSVWRLRLWRPLSWQTTSLTPSWPSESWPMATARRWCCIWPMERSGRAIEDFVEWSVKYDLWCKMRFFGQQMQEAIDSDHRMVCRTGPTNLLVFVPDTFTQMDIQQVYLL